MKIYQQIVVMYVAVILMTKPSYNFECGGGKKHQVLNGTIITVDLNEDIVVPEGTAVLLNSTIQRSNTERICINRTMHTGHPIIIDCFPSMPLDRDFKFNMNLQEEGGFLVLILQHTTTACKALYTWWSEDNGITMGNTMVTVEGYSDRLDVMARQNRTITIVHRGDSGQVPLMDVAFRDNKTDEDIYDFQINGDKLNCYSSVEGITPMYIKPYHMTVFKSGRCYKDGFFKIIVTDIAGKANSSVVRFQVEEKVRLEMTVLKRPMSSGDPAEISCLVSDSTRNITWKFNGKFIKNNTKHITTEVVSDDGKTGSLLLLNTSKEDIGTYSCEFRTDCNVVKNKSILMQFPDALPMIEAYVKYDLDLSTQSAELLCITTGNVMFAQWLFHGTILQNTSKHTIVHETSVLCVLRISDLGLNDVGQYACIVPFKDSRTLKKEVNIAASDIRIGRRDNSASNLLEHKLEYDVSTMNIDTVAIPLCECPIFTTVTWVLLSLLVFTFVCLIGCIIQIRFEKDLKCICRFWKGYKQSRTDDTEMSTDP